MSIGAGLRRWLQAQRDRIRGALIGRAKHSTAERARERQEAALRLRRLRVRLLELEAEHASGQFGRWERGK